MLEILPSPQPDVIAFRIDGKVTSAEYDRLAAEMEDRLERAEMLRAYAEIVSFEGMPIEAFFKDLRFGIKHWNDFSRAAVVTDESWLERVAAVEDKLLPHIRVRAFPLAEREAALKWVSQDG